MVYFTGRNQEFDFNCRKIRGDDYAHLKDKKWGLIGH